MSKTLEKPVAYKSPLHEMTQTTPTCLWNDSATLSELTYSIEHGGVGATCNPVIVLDALTYAGSLSNLSTVQTSPRFRFVQADIRDAASVGSA